MKTIQEIVSSALATASLHQQAKTASAASTLQVDADEDFLAGLLPEVKTAGETPKEEKKEDDEDEKAKKASILGGASYGLKLAEALETAASVVETLVTKVAAGITPATSSGTHEHTSTVSPKAQTPGGTAVAMQGGAKALQGAGKLPNDAAEKPKAAGEEISADAAATQRLLSAKIASYKVCLSMGQTAAAEAHKVAADALRAKIAAGIPLATSSGGEGSHVPDNAGMASLTKSQARDKNTREAVAAFGVGVKKDNAVAAHVGRTDGLKLSSLGALVGKAGRGLSAVGGKVLDTGARGAKSVAGAAENRLFNGAAAGPLKTKALEGAMVHGHNASSALTAMSGNEGTRKAVGAGLAGAAAGATLMGGKKKEAAPTKDEHDEAFRSKAKKVNAGVMGATGAMLGHGEGGSLNKKLTGSLKGKGKLVGAIGGGLAGAALGHQLGKRHADKVIGFAERREAATKED